MIQKSKKYNREQRSAIVGDREQILDLLEDLKTVPASVFRRTLSQARANEKIANGNLTTDSIIRNNITAAYAEDDTPRAPQAILANLVLTWSALICKDRQSVYAVPTANTLDLVSAAEIATKIIEYTEQEEDIANKWHASATYAAYHGTGMMYVYFDPVLNRVRWRPLSVFDCFIDDKADPSEIDYVVIREYIDPWTAEEMIIAADPEYAGEPALEKYQDGQGYDHEGVCKYIIWYKPCPRYPSGLYACIIDDVVVESTEYPYVFDDKDGTGTIAILPVAVWYCRRNRGTSLGITWASDVAPLQIALNELNSKLLRNAQTSQSYLVIPKALQNNEGFDPVSQIIAADPGSDMGNINWVSPAPLDPNQIQEKQNLIQSMYDSAGISQATAGQSSGASGRALAYQAELDSQKHADAFKSLEVAVRNAWNLDLKLKQKFYAIPQKILLDDMTEMVFTGSDIAGVDVRLESRSERESATSVKLERGQAAVGAGIAAPESLAEIQPKSVNMISETIANDLISRYLAGEAVTITAETVDPAAFAATIDKRIKAALLQRDIGTAQVLTELKAQYMRDMALQSMPPEAAPGTPPSTPEQPLPESIAAEGVGTVQ
jgi:hypothetical protein